MFLVLILILEWMNPEWLSEAKDPYFLDFADLATLSSLRSVRITFPDAFYRENARLIRIALL